VNSLAQETPSGVAPPSRDPAPEAEPDDDADLPPWPEPEPGTQPVELSAPAPGAPPGEGPEPVPAAPPEEPRPDPVTLVLNAGAYYSSVGLYLPLTRRPTPTLGEAGELRVYATLLARALVPSFVVLEASVNPMPSAGLLLRRWDGLYQGAQLTPGLNLVRSLTAGFEEPVAVSIFLGNVVRFAVPGRDDVRGRGYVGLVVSGGLWHITDNIAVRDDWLELELKLKGDRIAEVAKLSWSFRAGAKLHGNSEVRDVAFVGLRRSRLDADDDHFLTANSGIEYRFDLSLRGQPLRHSLVVDKKLPLGRRKVALVLGVGVLWESSAAYRGALGERRGDRLQLLLRPNVQW
jgi:hypothetical protein